MPKNTNIKRLALAVVLLVFFVDVSSQVRRAFVVGISNYNKSAEVSKSDNEWGNIHGANDIVLLTPTLKKQGFKITSLSNKAATANNIRNGLKSFASNCKPNDIVYIHFSCHGQPVEDLNGDEEDGWDEAIIPIDAYKYYKKGVYEGKKHLLDDQLNTYVKKLRDKIGPTGILYVVIDACHAGTSSRANDETVRGTKVGFTYHNKVFKPSANKKSHYKIAPSAKQSHVLYLEACRPDQVNMEIKVADKRYGPLSYNIAQALQAKPLSTNAEEFLNGVKASIMKGGHWPNNQNMVTETSF